MRTLRKLSQVDVNGMIDYLAYHVKGWKPDVIVAIAKGGLLPARLLARKLNVDRIISVGISFYNEKDEKCAEPTIYQGLEGCTYDSRDKMLIIDDITDSGESMKLCKQLLIEDGKHEDCIRTCAMFTKPRSVVTPDYVFDTVDNDTWVVFPWE